MIKKGTLVLIDSTEQLRQKTVNIKDRETVSHFHGKLMLVAGDESQNLCQMEKFTSNGWAPIYIEENNDRSGHVLFPSSAMTEVSSELFCEDNLEDVVLVQRKVWFEKEFGKSMISNEFPDVGQISRFHGKVLRVDWTETAKQKDKRRVLKKFTAKGWEYVYFQESKPESGYLLFPEKFLTDFPISAFFEKVNR
ncbi:MAG: hypothetical protein JNL74_04310 [Fibrobacteres bacterium]|nr:hypothetical protein [Fibrobacterota bacterium]